MNEKTNSENTRNPVGKPKGLPKSGGRQVGALNKKTYWLQCVLQEVGLNWGAEFKKAFDQDNFQKCQLLASLLPYLNPRVGEKQIDDEDSSKPLIQINYVKGDVNAD